VVKLAVKEEVAHISMCEGVRVDKELRKGNEVLIAHVMLIQEVKEKRLLMLEFVTQTLEQFKEVFDEPKELSPSRNADHQILLKPQTNPITKGLTDTTITRSLNLIRSLRSY
jgi:hypothetical protein